MKFSEVDKSYFFLLDIKCLGNWEKELGFSICDTLNSKLVK